MLIAEKDQTRAGYIKGLRMLADLLEQTPEIPHYDHQSIVFALGGSEAEAAETIERAAKALTAAGIEFEHRVNEQVLAVEFVLAGVRYSFLRMRDVAWAASQARRSYVGNVQVS